ncbi:MAG TPA: hypothetical protein VFA07_10685 [Chthonomonadaceae bacterium]|nr:hypothetical protein [Chthonomonadaceae bacterium]
MALIVSTPDPAVLLKAFKDKIDQGRIRSWSYDADSDFTMTHPDWKDLAWMRPNVMSDRIVFNFLATQDRPTTREVYALYHSRMIETLLASLDTLFEAARMSSQPVPGDVITKGQGED